MMLRRSIAFGHRTPRMAYVGLAAVTLSASIATSITAQTAASNARVASAPRVTASGAQLPLSFEPNVGQTHRDVKFLSRAAGYVLFLTATETVVASDGVAPVRFNWVGSNPRATVTGQLELPGKSHYYRGKDSRQWRSNVPGPVPAMVARARSMRGTLHRPAPRLQYLGRH